jgi:hypothetical protein
MTTFLTRISTLLFVWRLVGNTQLGLRTVVKWTIVFQIAQSFVAFCIAMFVCNPVSAAWSLDVRLDGGDVSKLYPGIFGIAIAWTVSDFWTVLLPMPMVMRLNMPRRSRIGAAVLFGMGLFASAASAVRISAIPSVFNSYNPNWHGPRILIWDQLEVTFGLIAASLPALNVVLKLIPISAKNNHSKSYMTTLPSSTRKSRISVNEYNSEKLPPVRIYRTDEHIYKSDPPALPHIKTSVFNMPVIDEYIPDGNHPPGNSHWSSRPQRNDDEVELVIQRPWDLRPGELRQTHPPDIAALSGGRVRVLRHFTPRSN